MNGRGRVPELLLRRRTFLGMLGLTVAALGGRLALLPRQLSEEEIAALAAAPAAPRPAPSRATASVGPPNEAEDLAEGFRESNHAKVQEVGLVPRRPQWRKVFKINTVERQPQRGLERWRLTVDGLVERPITLTLDEVLALPAERQISDFHCVEGWGVRDVAWRGVRIATLLEIVQPRPEAKFLTFSTLGGVYTESLTLEQALEPDVLLAYELNDRPLPNTQGYPLRVIVPAMFGYKGAKWLTRIELTDQRHVGFWERRGWPLDPWV